MLFVDTSFFFALASLEDPDHERVLEVFESLEGQNLQRLLVTTNHVVMETIRLARRNSGHALAAEVGRSLYSEKMARIHVASFEEEQQAFALLVKHRDKDYSPVDCLSFVVMEKLGIPEALTIDSDFTHRFVARPGPKAR